MSASLCRLVAPVVRQSCQLQLDRSPVASTLRANYVVACEVNEREFKRGGTCCFGKVKWLKIAPALLYIHVNKLLTIIYSLTSLKTIITYDFLNMVTFF